MPLKMQSDIRSARRLLWLCSPSTQEMASTILDLPQPLGPTMQVSPVPLKATWVRSKNDLNPTISTFLSLSKVTLSDSATYAMPRGLQCGAGRRVEMRVPLPRLEGKFRQKLWRVE